MALTAHPAAAQTDEIQVYNGEINEPGQASVTLHNNYTPIGRKVAAFPRGVMPQGALNGVPEWALGVKDWLELGLYLPLYSVTRDGRFLINGAELRFFFAEPHVAQRQFFYAINFEFSYNARHWEDTRYSSEIRPIVGMRFGPVDLIFNPIIDNNYTGIGSLDFAPAARIDYNFSEAWAVALEHYADYGKVRDFAGLRNEQQELFAVADYTGEPLDAEAGIGHGFTAGSDGLILKLMLTKTF
ncbi:MAG TPA: hypothetical protein VKV32_16175 [Stellaceae bacterium]|nr:hypothetical protein [Stellaceae bacterium]